MKTAKDILTSKVDCFNMVNHDDKVIKALQVMKCEDVNFVIVMRNDDFMGIMSETDYAKKVVLAGKRSDEITVAEIMSNNLPFAEAGDSMDTCLELMNNFGTRYLPVFENLHFIGVLSMQDLLRETVTDKASIALKDSCIY